MKKTRLLIVSMILMLLGSVCFAQDASYPDVWWREVPGNLKGFGITFLAVEKAYEANPSESPEVYMVMEKQKPNLLRMAGADRVFAIQGFFSGKQWRVTQVYFDKKDIPEKFRLDDERLLELIPAVTRPPETKFEDMDNEEGQKPVPPAKFGVQVISAFGGLVSEVANDPVRRWVRPSVMRSSTLESGIVACDPFYWGLQAFDKNGKRLWQHVIAAYGKPVLKPLGKSGKSGADPYYNECWTPGQYQVDTSDTVGPNLRDDTLLVLVNGSVLRIRLNDGYPARMPTNVSIVNYANVMRLKEVLSEGAFDFGAKHSIGVKRYRSEIGLNIDRNNFLAIQDYFFPQLAAKRYPGNASKVQHSSK